MKQTIFFAMIVFSVGFGSKPNNCIKGDILYSVAEYSHEVFLKPKYQKLFDSLFHESASNYFCYEKIRNLPRSAKKKGNLKPSQSHTIEPLFINLSNFDGVYAKRIRYLGPMAKNPRFTCGFYHYLFIVSQDEYFDLTADSLKNAKLFKAKLNSSFSPEELERITEYYKYGDICDSFTYHPPTFIKTNDTILFNAVDE